MSASNHEISVLLVGPYSYVGGVSVHMKRLAHILNKDIEIGILDDAPARISNSPHNIRRWRHLPGNIGYIGSHDIIHIHTGNWILRIGMILISLAMRKKVIVTLHSYRLSGLPRAITQFCLRFVHHVICVNEIIYQSVISRRKSLKEAFIPPVGSGCGLPQQVERLVRDNDDRDILCANAFRLNEYRGDDLYGLNQCIRVAEIAKENKDDIVIIFVVGRVDPGDHLYFEAVERISSCELSEYIHVIPYSVDFIEMIRRSDIVLRPTLTDGDALTVREALFLDKPVIASDVVPRPDGTFLYKTGDASDLYRMIKMVLAEKDQRGAVAVYDSSSGAGMESYTDYYRGIYRKCAGE